MSDESQQLREQIAKLSPEKQAQLAGRLRYELELRRTAWLCNHPQCAGTPHKSHPARHARANQRLPFKQADGKIGALWCAGRGFGKTRVGAEGVRQLVTRKRNPYGRVALIGRTAADVRDVMIEGESGLLSVFPKWDRPEYQPSKRRVTFSNGAIATAYSADKSDQLRGPQHDLIWGDEVSTWPKLLDVSIDSGKPGPEGVLTNALLGLRLGSDPRAILTGTPRPTRDMRYLVAMPSLYVITGTTYENLNNLASVFRDIVIGQYEGTRVGRQELLGELLKDVEGALLSYAILERDGFRPFEAVKDISTITVNIDPAVTTSTKSNFTGISVTASDAERKYGYVLHSERVKDSPQDAMLRAAKLYDQYMASYVVAEVNQGGDYVKEVMRQIRDDIPVKTVHASIGKVARAEPVIALYEQGRIMHVGSPFTHAALEDELTTWVPRESDESPDVMDSVVWGFTNLMTGKKAKVVPKARSYDD